MHLIVGLGNPGNSYRFTRHNIGFLAVETLGEDYGIALSARGFNAHYGKGRIGNVPVLLAQPQTFMNLSGTSVMRLREYYKIADPRSLIVIHDDLDLPFGTVRLKAGGGLGGHKGMISLSHELGSHDFLRVRVGIGRPPTKHLTEGYVLAPFAKEEAEQLPSILGTVSDAVSVILASGIQSAMNQFHATNTMKEEAP